MFLTTFISVIPVGAVREAAQVGLKRLVQGLV
jgi:hypothetical protein